MNILEIRNKFESIKKMKIGFMGATASGKTFFRNSLLHTLSAGINSNWFSIHDNNDYSQVIDIMIDEGRLSSTAVNESKKTFTEMALTYENRDLFDVILFDTYGAAFEKNNLQEVEILSELRSCNAIINFVDSEEFLLNFVYDKYLNHLKSKIKENGYNYRTDKILDKYVLSRKQSFDKCARNRALITRSVNVINNDNRYDNLIQTTIVTKCDSEILPIPIKEMEEIEREYKCYINPFFFDFAGQGNVKTLFKIQKNIYSKTNELIIIETFNKKQISKNILERSYYKHCKDIFQNLVISHINNCIPKLQILLDDLNRLKVYSDESGSIMLKKEIDSLTNEISMEKAEYEKNKGKSKILNKLLYGNSLSKIEEKENRLELKKQQYRDSSSVLSEIDNLIFEIKNFYDRCNYIIRKESY